MEDMRANELQHPVLLTDIFETNASIFSSATAVVCGGTRLTWEQLYRGTNKVANSLVGLGLAKGSKIGLLMGSTHEMLLIMLGIVRAGMVAVPFNLMSNDDDIGAMISNSDSSFVFADASTIDQLSRISGVARGDETNVYLTTPGGTSFHSSSTLFDAASSDDPGIEIEPSDSMSIIYSSGTTGMPKGIEHSHSARNMFTFGTGPAIGIDRHSVVISTTPLFSNGTLITLLPNLFYGGKTVLMPKFDPENFLKIVEQEGGTHVFMVPTQYIRLLEVLDPKRHNTSSLKSLVSAGAPLSSTTLGDILKAFPNAKMYQIYGMSEGFITVSTPEDRKDLKGNSVGIPWFGTDIRIIGNDDKEVPRGETGEIVGWSSGIMKGYYHRPDLTRDIIWLGSNGRKYLRSGDIGYLDAAGNLFIAGRKKDMIISGGFNVFPTDIENLFMQHPDVNECVAVGVPHPKWGETPVLFVIAKLNSNISAEKLIEWGNQRLGKHQRVASVQFRDEFPRAGLDKVIKQTLREQFVSGMKTGDTGIALSEHPDEGDGRIDRDACGFGGRVDNESCLKCSPPVVQIRSV